MDYEGIRPLLTRVTARKGERTRSRLVCSCCLRNRRLQGPRKRPQSVAACRCSEWQTTCRVRIHGSGYSRNFLDLPPFVCACVRGRIYVNLASTRFAFSLMPHLHGEAFWLVTLPRNMPFKNLFLAGEFPGKGRKDSRVVFPLPTPEEEDNNTPLAYASQLIILLPQNNST